MESGISNADPPPERAPAFPLSRMLQAATSLQCKATIVVVVLTLSVTAAVSGYLLQSSKELAESQHDTQMLNMAGVLAKAAATTILNGNSDELQALADGAANGAPLLYVIFSDVEGRQLAVAEHRNANVLRELQRDQDERVPVPGHPKFHVDRAGAPVYLDVTFPITTRSLSHEVDQRAGDAKLLGYVRTGMIANRWRSTMLSKLDLVVGVGILATVGAIPLGFLLVRRIVSPLDGLADAMLSFSRGKLDVRSGVHRRDEIGRLAGAFNRMADQHQQTHERIVRLNAELERRVADRTKQLHELASREPLTGLYNRRFFNEMLEQRFSEALRYESALTCMMIDLDDFKAVNDAFGHHVGDELLVLTGRSIASQLRTADVVARFGGDEFIVLLPQTDADRARVLAERVMDRFTSDVRSKLPQVQTGMSVGIASTPMSDVEEAEALIRLADHALYDAKSAGKNCIITAGTASKPASL